MNINPTDDFSAAPYFDDFKRENHQYKILFKAGTPVQTRELVGLQSILQDQIAVLGSHLFKNGSMVIPGTPRYNESLSYVYVEKVVTDTTMGERLIGTTLTQVVDALNNIELHATVENWIDFSDRALLVLNYQNSAVVTVAGVTENKKEFDLAAELEVSGSTEKLTVTESQDPADIPRTGNAQTLSVQEGVFYVDGYFVHTPEQRIVVGYNGNAMNIKAGFLVNKAIQTAYDNPDLFDNALGSPNEAAPGADRFTIDLELSVLDLNDNGPNFIELIRLENGYLRVSNVNPQYNVIADTMARRTYDESGDYSVRGFDLKVYEDLKDEQNPNGFMTAAKGGDANRFVVEVSSGKGYVKGYEVENLSNYFLRPTKARTSDCERTANDIIQVNEYGSYIHIAPGNQYFDISRHPIIWLTDGQENTANIIGYCIPKYMDSINISGQTIFKLYGTFQLNSTATFGWQTLGGWRLNDLKNGPVLQVVNMVNTVGSFNVVDGLPLTSHTGYTPYAWDAVNQRLYVKKTTSAPAFDKSIAVTKGSTTGYATSITYSVTDVSGDGELFKLNTNSVKTVKDSLGNVELQTDVAFTLMITTNSSGYGEYNLLSDGIFVGNPIAANTILDNSYYDNLVSIENGGTRLVINNVSLPNTQFAVSAVLRKQLTIRSKALTEGSTLITEASARTMVLGHRDIYRIKHIYVSADNATAPDPLTDRDIGEFYELVNRDTLDFYFNTGMKAKRGFARPAGQLLVVYDYFIHSAGEVYTVDSYASLRDNVTDEDDVTHIGRIPKFSTKEASYILSDYLDFRRDPRDGFFIIKGSFVNGSNQVTIADDYRSVINVGAPIFAAGFEVTPTTITAVNESTFTLSETSTVTGSFWFVVNAIGALSAAEPFAASQTTWTAINGSTVTYDATYFVDRFDRIVITSQGQINYIYGVPGVGSYPAIPDDSMSLGVIRTPAYTWNANQVWFKKDDNRRYTMRDIGKLEDRIENLEYYTTLTLKELETKEMKILDADGLDRFKSGLFVSNFTDFGVFNPFSEETPYRATLVPEKRKMIPLEYATQSQLDFDEVSSSSFRVINDKIFAPFTEVVEIEQPYATRFQTLNPYLVIVWDPELVLSPSEDSWVETEWAPTITNITEVVQNTSSQEIVNTSRTIDNTSASLFSGTGTAQAGAVSFSPAPARPRNTAGTVSTSSTTTSRQTTMTTTRTSESSSETHLIGTSIIPMIRSRDVEFTMTGSKPTTRYWVRFDNVDVSAYCAPVDSAGVMGQFGDDLISDPMGKLVGVFRLPPGQFRTGERILEVSDVDKENRPDETEFCVATATYTANGTLETMQEIVNIVNTTINNTHTVITNNTVVTINDAPPVPPPVVDEPDWDAIIEARRQGLAHGDPLAQSFFTSDVRGPGMFVTEVDVYFAKKDYTEPAFLELKEVVNGMPVNLRIPGSLTFVESDDVNITDDSTVPTTFRFSEPVYLQSNREYAFVVGSNSARYSIWTAKLGEKIINEDRVLSEQPSLGSLFKSQNNSTWTPYQLEDIKFRIKRCKFDTSAMMELAFANSNSGARRRAFIANMQTQSGSNLLRIYHPNHGTLVNEFVTIEAETNIGLETMSPAVTDVINGFTMGNIYGDKLVKIVHNINEYSIEMPNNANNSGYMEDIGKYVYIASNVNFNKYRLSMQTFEPGGTNVRYYSQLMTGKDFDGGQSTKVIFPEENIKNNETNLPTDVGLIQIPANESTTKSIRVRLECTTGYDTVAPVIYTGNNGLTVASLAVNSPDVDDEDQATGGSVNSKAITQVIRLETLSNSIRVYTAENKQEKDAIEIWFRSTASRDIEERTWQLLAPENIAVQNDLETYIEHARSLDGIPEFDEYQIKVVFKCTNSIRYPSINELRVITVAS